MSYTAPLGDSVHFAFDETGYTAPEGDAVYCNLSPSAGEVSLTGSGALSLAGAAVGTHGTRFQAGGGIVFGGTADFRYAVTFDFGGSIGESALSGPISIEFTEDPFFFIDDEIHFGGAVDVNRGELAEATGAISLGGSASLELHKRLSLSASGGIRLVGAAPLYAGRPLSVVGRIGASGMASIGTGRCLSASGTIVINTENAEINVGRTFVFSGRIALRGSSTQEFHPRHSLTGSGSVRLQGGAAFSVPRKTLPPSIPVLTAVERMEVFCHVI